MESRTKKILVFILATLIALLIVIMFTKKNENTNDENVFKKSTTMEEQSEASIYSEDKNTSLDTEKEINTTVQNTTKHTNKVSPERKSKYSNELPIKTSNNADKNVYTNSEEENLKSEPAAKLVEVNNEIVPNNNEFIKFRGVTYRIKIKQHSQEGINDNQEELN